MKGKNDRDQEWPRSKNDRDQESPRSKAKMTLKMTRRSLTDTTKKFTPFPKTGHETAIWPRITEIKNDRDQKMTEIRNVRDQESPRSKTKMTINTDTTKKWWFHALKCSVETGGLSTLYNRWNRSNITKQEKYNSIGLPSTLGMSMGVPHWTVSKSMIVFKSLTYTHSLCDIDNWLRPHKSEIFGLGLNHIRLQHFTCKII